MRDGTSSRTAELTAAIRACHYLYDDPQIFSDPFALDLTSARWRLICRNRLLHWYIVRRKFAHLRPVHGWILSRSEIAETRLREFVEAGGRQYVQIGAGFDSMALRSPSWIRGVKMFELDRRETQALKSKRIRCMKHEVPQNLEYVAVDLEKESVSDCLARSSFNNSLRTFYSWLGVIYYLSERAINSTLDSIRRISPPGSEVIFDFLVPEESLNHPNRDVLKNTGSYTASLGEPYVSFHSMENVQTLAATNDFDIVSLMTDEQIEQEYFHARRDDLRLMRGCAIAHIRSV